MRSKMYMPLFMLFALLSCKEAKKEEILSAPVTVIKKDSTIPKRDSIVKFAEKYLGTAYCYGSNNPKKGFDCSGFVNFVFAHYGIELPRSSSGFADFGTPLQPDEFKKGDILVFYGYKDSTSIGHVGIVYEADGMNSTFIHASSGLDYAVTISDLDSDMYTKRFYKCIDVITP